MSEQACPYCHISRDWLLPNSPCCRAQQDVEAARAEVERLRGAFSPGGDAIFNTLADLAHTRAEAVRSAESGDEWATASLQLVAEVERLRAVIESGAAMADGMECGAVGDYLCRAMANPRWPGV